MIVGLCNEKCEACKLGAPTISEDELKGFMPSIPGWAVVEENQIKKLRRSFKFRNFAEALNFTDKVGLLAEQNGHHPAILTEWGNVTVTYWTHKIKGLHRSDVIMAAKTDRLYQV